MSAVDYDDMTLELARCARMATERMMERRKLEQKGEAFAGLTLRRFILPTIPAKAD